MSDLNTVGIIGAGQMGCGIAHVFALSGSRVLLNDISQERIEAGIATITGNLARQVAGGKITEADNEAALSRLHPALNLSLMSEAGLAIAPDGELSSAVSAQGSGISGFSDAVLAAGVQNGARWLQAFDTVLPEKYSQFGFKPVARIKFSKEFFVEEHGEEALEEFMKINKRFNGGMPDLVFMAYDPKFKNTVANNVGGQFTDDYDKAVNAAKKAAKVK